MTAVEHGCRTPAQLGGQLLKESGIEEVQRLVDQLFRDRAELITADSVLSHLERTVLSDAQLGPLGRHRVRDLIEAVRSDDRATGLRRLKALRLALDKTIPLNGERRAELRPLLSCGQARERLGDDGSRALGELIREARARREWWQGLGNVMPSLPERRWLAGEVVHSYDEVLGELTHSH